MVSQEKITEAARTLAATAASPATVILFGSYARGDADGGSDVDFLVVEDDLSDQIGEYVRLRKAIGRIGSAVDILVGENEKMLKNAKSEYHNEFEEIATYTGIEALAEAVGDRDTAKLARDIRREEERMARRVGGATPRTQRGPTGTYRYRGLADRG